MKRELKFRAWDKENKIMHQPVSLLSNWDGNTMSYKGETNQFIYMPYIGLKDRNGKEIYLGDVVFEEDGEFSKTVEICESEEPESIGYFAKDIYTDDSFANSEVDGVVLGNIYANPELLTNIIIP